MSAKHAKNREDFWRDGMTADVAATRYARENYGSGSKSSVEWGSPNVPEKRRRGPQSWVARIFIGVAAVLAIIIIAVAVYAFDFNSRVHGNLSTPDALPKELTPAEAGKPYYILLLGSDWRENSGTSKKEEMSGDQQRADVIILARMDPAKKKVTLVSIPRDTRWVYKSKTFKINEAYNIGGAALETQAISELTGVPIAHTVETHFSGVEALVDALGGVEVDVPKDISYKDALTGKKVKVEKGRQLLNGKEAQIFARVRKAYTKQDEARQGNVRTLVTAIADTMRQKPIHELPALGLKVADCFGTDMNLVDFVELARDFGGDGLKVYSGSGPTDGEIDESADGQWLCYDNPEGWKAVMDAVDAGKDPSKIDANSYRVVEEPAPVAEGYYDEFGNWIDASAYTEEVWE